MTQPAVQSTNPAPRNPIAAHPVTSAAIAILITAAICCTLFVQIYARVTPKVGDWPFFYFYLLAYMPVVSIALWVVTRLQKRLEPRGPVSAGSQGGSDGGVAQ
jgi:Na+/melibiose symporter-like transporter